MLAAFAPPHAAAMTKPAPSPSAPAGAPGRRAQRRRRLIKAHTTRRRSTCHCAAIEDATSTKSPSTTCIVVEGWASAIATAHAQAPAPPRTCSIRRARTPASSRSRRKCASCHDTGTDGAPDRYALNRRTPEEVLAKITQRPACRSRAGLTEFAKRDGGICRRAAARRRRGRRRGDDEEPLRRRAGRLRRSPGRSGTAGAVIPRTRAFSRRPGSPPPTRRSCAEVGLRVSHTAIRLRTASHRRRAGVRRCGHRVRLLARCARPVACTGRSGRTPAFAPRPRSAPARGAHRFLLYFGDIRANVYAVNAETGALVWKERLDTAPIARVTGAPKLAGGRLYVPLSSLEESGAGNPAYPCCTFRGGVAAYDALTRHANVEVVHGRRRAEADEDDVEGHAALGTRRRRRVVVTDDRSRSGEPSTSRPATATPSRQTKPPTPSIAFDLDTGKRLWAEQVMALDSLRARLPGHLPAERAEGQQVRNVPGRSRARLSTSATRRSCARYPAARRSSSSARRAATRGPSIPTSKGEVCGAGSSGWASRTAAAG